MHELELIPLCEVRMMVGETLPIGAAASGEMAIGEIVNAKWEGDRFRASLRGHASADWMTFGPGGTGIPDVRLTLETFDGALVYVSYSGRFVGSSGIAYTTPVFRTGDPRYGWMNTIQAVGKGTFDAPTREIHYPMIYEMR